MTGLFQNFHPGILQSTQTVHGIVSVVVPDRRTVHAVIVAPVGQFPSERKIFFCWYNTDNFTEHGISFLELGKQ